MRFLSKCRVFRKTLQLVKSLECLLRGTPCRKTNEKVVLTVKCDDSFFYFQFIYNCIKKEAVRATSFLKGGLPFCIKKITKILVLDIKTIFLSYIEFEPV